MTRVRDDGRPGEYFTWSEMQTTSTGLPNVAPRSARHNLRRLCHVVLDPLRRIVGPVRVNSGYRSLAVNTAVGGSRTSVHMRGLAADIVALSSEWPAERVATLLAQSPRELVPFDQVILYASGFVHVGLVEGTPRRQLLYSSGGRYTAWTPPEDEDLSHLWTDASGL